MITKDQVIPLLVEACPSFRELKAKSPYAESQYAEVGDLARHLLMLHQSGHTGEFPAVAQVVERFLVEGDHFVRELAAVGFLEGVQNVWSNNNADVESFSNYLLPEGKRWWQSRNDFWSGKSKIVGEGMLSPNSVILSEGER